MPRQSLESVCDRFTGQLEDRSPGPDKSHTKLSRSHCKCIKIVAVTKFGGSGRLASSDKGAESTTRIHCVIRTNSVDLGGTVDIKRSPAWQRKTRLCTPLIWFGNGIDFPLLAMLM